MDKLIAKLKENEIHLTLKGEELKVQFNSDSIDSELVEEIRSNKPALIEYLQSRQANSTEFESIPLAKEGVSFPLSSAQKRLWTICQLDEVNVAYNEHQMEFIEGEINVEAIRRAFETLLDRYEVLRTSFYLDDNEDIRQWVTPFEDLNFDVEVTRQGDLTGSAAEYIREVLATPFDLEKAPLLRVYAVEVEPNKWVICNLMHHIICDGWTIELLRKEFVMLYTSYVAGSSPTLSPLKIQYKDYAVWQQEQLQNEEMEVHKKYWLDRFEHKPPLHTIPTDFSRPAFKTHNGSRIRMHIEGELVDRLESLCKKNGGTLFMGLLSAVNCLVYKYTGQSDIVLGSPIAGREHPDLEDQLGHFLNTLALRTSFNGNMTFLELLHSIRQTTLEAYEHQTYPFDELVENVPFKLDKSRTPIFDIMVGLLNTKVGSNNLREEAVEAEGVEYNDRNDYEHVTSKFDMTFNFIQRNGGLYLGLEYNADLYKKASIERMLKYFGQLLHSIVENPESGLDNLNYLDAEEKSKIAEFSRGKSGDSVIEGTVADYFETIANKFPERTAVCFGETLLSYAELDELSNRFANYLKEQHGVAHEDFVGLKLERSHRMVIAILGAFKAGAAYIPLDPGHPEARIEFIENDSNCKVILDDNSFEQFVEKADQYSGDAVDNTADSATLAYVLYTSGSTGTPKGVLVEHHSVLNLTQAYSLENGLKSSLTTNFVFDVSVLEVFAALLSGGELHIPTIDQVMDPSLFADFIASNSIEHTYIHPMLLQNVSSELSKREHGLKRILTGVQSITIDDVEWYLNEGIEVRNGYGPTETTVCATMYKLDSERLPDTKIVPIGKPLSGYNIFLVDTSLNPVGIGMSGELCIAGVGVSRGYLNRPEMTEEMFIENPNLSKERIYRTGDQGRWLEDGSIEFLGRQDDQLKINGYRIEIREVESAIEKVEFVHNCAVVPRTDERGEKSLVAYVEVNYGVSPEDLKTELRTLIPEYMIPQYFLKIEELPMNENGKVDKKSLPDLEELGLTPVAEYVAPENDIQKKLVDIWEDLLGVENIGIKDDFFVLGGNSLKVIRLISKINKEFGLKYDLKGVYSESTIEKISEKIRVDTWFKDSEDMSEEYEEIKI